MIYTYQDYVNAKKNNELAVFVGDVINWHRGTELYKTALTADEYDRERNTTILNFIKWVFTGSGNRIQDETTVNTKITSNFFARLNNQRCLYSLGKGLAFRDKTIRKKLGRDADKTMKDAGYYGLIHGVSFLYWAYDHIHMFKVTEFCPLYDENTGDLSAGVRFWRLDETKPLHAVLYTPDGYLEFLEDKDRVGELVQEGENFKAYRMTVHGATATTGEVVTQHNYSRLPIVPLYGSRLRQSTLIGMQSKIDAFDIIFSGFANDLQECAQIYWIISGADGMSEKDVSEFRKRLLYRHMAAIKQEDAKVQPYTQEVPYSAREAMLNKLRAQIYEDFGGLDVHTVAAGATNDHIEAAYQPLDEQANDFELQITEAVRMLLALQGVDSDKATPQFKRTRVSNQLEFTQMVMMAGDRLDDEAILDLLPFITPEQAADILNRKTAEEMRRVEEVTEEVTEDGETG